MTDKKEVQSRDLTPEQRAKIPQYVEKWIAIRDNAEPANRAAAEEGIRESYAAHGNALPMILWTGSPYGNALAMVALSNSEKINEDFCKSRKIKPMLDQTRVDNALIRVLSFNQTWEHPAFPEKGITEADLEKGLSAYIETWREENSIRNDIANVAFDSNYGQHDAAWLAFYDLFRNEAGRIEETDKHVGAMKIAENANWWYPTDLICFICERPKVYYDGVGRLHHDTLPAIHYPDGFGVYVWHSHMIDRKDEWFCRDRSKITVAEINKMDNAETRRVMLEMHGYDRYFEESGGVVIDEDVNHGEKRQLIRMRVAGEDVEVVRVVNGSYEPDGTKRAFVLGAMPNNGGKVHNAIAASYGVNPTKYKEAVRT